MLPESMSEVVTSLNAVKYRNTFCELTGHGYKCVEGTIDKMLFVMGKTSLAFGIDLTDAIDNVYDNLDIVRFDNALLKLLAVKGCACRRSKKH